MLSQTVTISLSGTSASVSISDTGQVPKPVSPGCREIRKRNSLDYTPSAATQQGAAQFSKFTERMQE